MKRLDQSTQEKHAHYMVDQRQFFDELITREWDTYLNAEWDRTRRHEVDMLFRLVSPRKVLDVGCGCGFHDLLMAEQSGVVSVTGIDYSEKSIETANRVYSHPKVHRMVADVLTMPRGDYDLAVSFQVIEHLPDGRAFLEACARQVIPGGYVAAVTPNRLRLANRLRISLGGSPKLSDPQHYCEYLVPELVSIGETLSLEYFGHFGYGMALSLPRLGVRLVPLRVGLSLGRMFPGWSDCFGVIFRKRAGL